MAYIPTLNEVVVRNPSDLSGALSSLKTYVIDGVIDMGTTSIQVPSLGLNIKGLGFCVSKLRSSELGHRMFINPSGVEAGNLFLTDICIENTGSGSVVFLLDNDENDAAVEINNVNFDGCDGLGQLTAYRQFLMRNVGIFDCNDGLVFSGNWDGGARIETCLVRDFGASASVFSKGTSLVFNNRFVSNVNASIPSTSIVFDFEDANIANDGDFELFDARFITVGGGLALYSSILSTSVKSRFRNCRGLRNTYVGAQWSVTGEVATPCVLNTPIKLLGTTTYSDEQWFDNSVSNAFEYISTQEIEVEVRGVISLFGGNNKQVLVQARKWDDSLSSYAVLSSTTVTTNGGGGNRAENVSILGYVTMNQNDRIEIWIINQTDSTDITVGEGGLVSVSERSS